MRNREKKIDYILKHFDFKRVHKAMDALGWTYWDSNDSTPSIRHLRKVAKGLLEKVKDDNYNGTGGFWARADGEILELSFSIDEWNSEFYNRK